MTQPPTRARHVVLALTVAAYMITYMDRVNIASAAPLIRHDLGLSMVTMGWILSAFRWGYALFQIPSGWMGDRIGPRRALTLIVTWWSVFTSATALAWSAGSMIAIRFLFGVGESGAFPIATRSLSRWMLPSERGFAQGITHAGSRLGAAATPVLVVALMTAFGWRSSFVVFGFLGLIWAAVWFWYYRDTPGEHAGVNEAERRLIYGSLGLARSGTTKSVPWRRILASPTLWTLSLMYFCYSYCLSVYLDWFPTYLHDHRGFDFKQMGFYASMPLLAGTLGDLMGGWISDLWVKRTHNLKLARRAVGVFGFLLAAAAILPATFTASPTGSVWYTCVAVFGLELTVGVSWAIPLDIGGDYAGSVSAVMNSCGNIGGAISPALLAFLVRGYGWNVPFAVAAGMCAIAAALFMRIDATQTIFAESQ
ncbi:MAG: MFS transporter [Acidobacteriota bacterium]|nr:MFS transporter [Acidobacteriota bacterium]